jgi:hypothetical protein
MSSVFLEFIQKFHSNFLLGHIATGDLKRALSKISHFENVESYDVAGGFEYEESDG